MRGAIPLVVSFAALVGTTGGALAQTMSDLLRDGFKVAGQSSVLLPHETSGGQGGKTTSETYVLMVNESDAKLCVIHRTIELFKTHDSYCSPIK